MHADLLPYDELVAWIYRDIAMVNWCPFCRTAISDVEVEYRERDVRIAGRVAPSLAGELVAVADAWDGAVAEAAAVAADR